MSRKAQQARAAMAAALVSSEAARAALQARRGEQETQTLTRIACAARGYTLGPIADRELRGLLPQLHASLERSRKLIAELGKHLETYPMPVEFGAHFAALVVSHRWALENLPVLHERLRHPSPNNAFSLVYERGEKEVFACLVRESAKRLGLATAVTAEELMYLAMVVGLDEPCDKPHLVESRLHRWRDLVRRADQAANPLAAMIVLLSERVRTQRIPEPAHDGPTAPSTP